MEPLPLCAFKFNATKLAILQEAYETFGSVIEKFGVFEFDDPGVARRIASNPQDFQDKVRKLDNFFFICLKIYELTKKL